MTIEHGEPEMFVQGRHLVVRDKHEDAGTSHDRVIYPDRQAHEYLSATTHQRVVDTITELTVPTFATESHRVAKYSPRFRLAFSLLNEDASSGKGVFTWDVEKSIQS